MTMAITFDTLQFVKTLVEAEVPQKQAEAYAKAYKDAQDNSVDGLATKYDLKDVRGELREVRDELKHEIQEVRKEIDVKCAELKVDLIKWMIGLLAGQTAIVASMIKFMH